MGARLVYAKVIDRELFFIKEQGRAHPSMENQVVIDEESGEAGAFLVLRGWGNDHGTFTEQWRLTGPGGRTVYESLPRELHLPSESHVARLEDELSDLNLEDAADDYHIVFTLDEDEVARVRFSVRPRDNGR